MTPNDTFSYLRENAISYDNHSMARLYQPILGLEAVGLYAYLATFWDNGAKPHKFTEILNHMQFGMSRFEEALALLTAMDLVAFYQTGEGYLIHLKPALLISDFLANPAYSRLLEQRIGEAAFKNLMVSEPDKARNLSKKFSDLFSDFGNLELTKQSKGHFDWDSFQKRMFHDGLRLDNEKDDVLALYSLAERYRLTWFDLYQVAKETAYQGVILPKRLSAKLEKNKQANVPSDFSDQEKILLHKAKSSSPQVLLAEIKKGRRATVTTDELKVLDDLVAMNFLDEVINVMVIYTLAKTKSANLNKTYLMKIANDFAYQEVKSAEVAISKMRSFDQRKKDSKPKAVKSNVPDWSKQDYKNETTQEEQERLEELKRQALARLGGSE